MSSFCRLDELSQSSNDSYSLKGNDSLCETLSNFGKLRISALTKAAEISPLVKEVTIGPNSSPEKQKLLDDSTKENGNQTESDKENLVEDKLGDDLRYTLNMRKIEANMQENTEVVFKNLVEKMIAKRTESMMRYWQKQSEDSERKALEVRARKLRMLKELQDNDNLSVLEKAKQDEKTTQKINQQTLEGMNRILEEQNRAAARFASITDSHTKVCICYNEINSMLQKDTKTRTICEKYINTLNTVSGNITTILDLCKTGTITDKEVKQAEVLAANIENIKKKIVDEIEEQKRFDIERLKQEEIAKQKEEEQRRSEEARQQEKEKKLVIEKKASEAVPMFYSPKNYAYYEELKNFLAQYENQYKDLVENKAYKKFKADCQKAVNTPANTICGVTGAHLRDKYDKLSKLIKGEQVQVLDTYVQATQHPQGLSFVTALLAKKIVKQGELLVSSNPDAAYPVAAVTAALLAQFPEFGKLLEAYFHRECPYIVPMYLPQIEGQSDKDFYLSRGYKYNEEGVVEKQNMFLKRMSGIFKLKCAIWIAKTPRFVNVPNPHGLRHAWKWIASFINLKPEPDISATLLHDFFNICGSECYKCYGKQFIKVIKVIATQYMPILDNIDTGGPKSRLEDFLQNVLKTGHIPPPTGTLSPNAW